MAARSKRGSGVSGKSVRTDSSRSGPVKAGPQTSTTENRQPTTLLSDWDYHLFNEGSHHRLWDKLGAHLLEKDGVSGTMFAVWAPNAAYVSVIGDFNGWNRGSHPLESRGPSGIW